MPERSAVHPHPFTPADSPLRDVLRDRYLLPVLDWLLGRDEETILAQKAGSCWESALTIIILSDAKQVLSHASHKSLLARASSRSAEVARWLLAKAQRWESGDGKYVCWEGVTWDTAVIVRGLITILRDSPHEFSAEKRDEVESAVIHALDWLSAQFRRWTTEIKYPFGPADVAQIALTLIAVDRQLPEIFAKTRHVKDGPKELLASIVRYLLHIKKDRTLQARISEDEKLKIATCWWTDFFNTAEVLEAFSEYYEYSHRKHKADKAETQLRGRVRESLVSAIAFLDNSQGDGTWGTHIDTLRVIHAYIKLCRMMTETGDANALALADHMGPELHTTFKALRWICDSKQVFSDGSFLHTMFLTVFYAQALVEVCQSWKPAQACIDALYDDVVWFSPIRSTPERSLHLARTLEVAGLREELADLRASAAAEIERVGEESRRRGERDANTSFELRRYLWMCAIIPGLLVVSACVSVLLGIFTLTWPLVRTQTATLNDGIAFWGVAASVTAAVAAGLWAHLGHRHKQRPPNPKDQQ